MRNTSALVIIPQDVLNSLLRISVLTFLGGCWLPCQKTFNFILIELLLFLELVDEAKNVGDLGTNNLKTSMPSLHVVVRLVLVSKSAQMKHSTTRGEARRTTVTVAPRAANEVVLNVANNWHCALIQLRIIDKFLESLLHMLQSDESKSRDALIRLIKSFDTTALNMPVKHSDGRNSL